MDVTELLTFGKTDSHPPLALPPCSFEHKPDFGHPHPGGPVLQGQLGILPALVSGQSQFSPLEHLQWVYSLAVLSQ